MTSKFNQTHVGKRLSGLARLVGRNLHLFGLAMLIAASGVGVDRAAAQEDNNGEPAPRPNIILMMADDMGWGDVEYQGHAKLKTPNLNDMAKNGLRLERFYAAAPVCSPTRGSCLTGRHPYRYGIFFANVGHMLPQEITLAEILADAGYATGHFGKWHLGTLTKTVKDANRGGPKGIAHFSPPEVNGFAENFSTESKVPTFDPLLRPKSAKGKTWWLPAESPQDAIAYGTHYWSQGKMIAEDLSGDDSKVILDRAIPFVRKHAGKQPFFAVIWFHAPHLPVVASERHRQPYADENGYTQSYYGCIAAIDEQVGRLRKELRDLKIADETLLFYCSDNGPEGNVKAPGSAAELRGRKRSLYEGGVRVPGIIEWPGQIEAGCESSIPAVTSDYLPTILDLLKLEYPDDRPLDGVSLAPLFAGRMKSRPQPIGFESSGVASWVDNRFKLIGVVGKAKSAKQVKWELYDLLDDPSESNDVAAAHPDVVEKMVKQLEEWRASCGKSLAGDDY